MTVNVTLSPRSAHQSLAETSLFAAPFSISLDDVIALFPEMSRYVIILSPKFEEIGLSEDKERPPSLFPTLGSPSAYCHEA